MFEAALELVLQSTTPKNELPRLKAIVDSAQGFGWGFTDQINDLFALFLEKIEAQA